jgi:hypothetical protein
MKVTYGPKLQQSKELLGLAQKALPHLEDVLGRSADRVMADWEWDIDTQNRPFLTLQLSDDYAGSVKAPLAPDELKDTTQLRIRLFHLWGDLLQAQSHKQLQAIMQAGDAHED